ncbi:MAG: leucine-rich repeat domain-containing protein [Lachnospiraceae bacterium]|nr:leucine-rich repeat domain-containing protein [Lachnospiraceae bacterium]
MEENTTKAKKFNKKYLLLILIPILIAIAVLLFLIGRRISTANTWQEQYDLGMQYLEDGEYEAAVVAFTTAIETEPKNAEAYEQLVQLYMQEGRLDEAKALLEQAVEGAEGDEETMETISKLYYVSRPEPPTASYEDGDYEDRIRVELYTSGEQQTIYYTLDGTEPTEESLVYTDPLILYNGVNTIRAIAVNTTGYQSDIAVFEYNVLIEDVLVELEEPLIEQIIRDKLGLDSDEPIRNDHIAQITELYIVGNTIGTGTDDYVVTLEEPQYSVNGNTYQVSENSRISTLNDIQYMPFLETVVAVYQPGLDISALSGCENLKELSLVGDDLTSRSLQVLSGLTTLEKLNLGWNSIQSISTLSGLSNLQVLSLWGNSLTDISPVSGLTQLTYLDISDNHVTNISALSGLTQLTELWLYHNSVTDISALQGLENLQVLMIRDNPVENPEEIRSVYAHLTRLDVDLLGLGGDAE